MHRVAGSLARMVFPVGTPHRVIALPLLTLLSACGPVGVTGGSDPPSGDGGMSGAPVDGGTPHADGGADAASPPAPPPPNDAHAPNGYTVSGNTIIDANGQEITFAYVNAVLRDWARLGLMLANNGNWQGKTIVPADWLAASAADALPTDSPLAKYGYQIWYSADTRRFALRGIRGQFVFVDPDLKLVLVQTALSGGQPETVELFALWNALRAQMQ